MLFTCYTKVVLLVFDVLQLVVISKQTEVKHVFQKFDLSQVVKPVKDKVEQFNDFLAVLYHPNFGGISYLNPSYFWEKLKEKKEHLLPSAHVAIFGKGQHELHDYPSAYRKG